MLGVGCQLEEGGEVSTGKLADDYKRDVDSVSGLPGPGEEEVVVVGRFAGQLVAPSPAAIPVVGLWDLVFSIHHTLHLEGVQEVAGGQPLASASADVEAAAGVRTL